MQDIPKEQVELALERPENFKISVNGHKVDGTAINGWWVDKCFKRITIPIEFLNMGRNMVELETGFHEGVNLEVLYLLGKFGVQIDGSKKTLVGLAEKIFAADLTAQSLPFYTGKILYSMKACRRLEKGERIFISLDRFEAACIKVKSCGKPERIIAWQPYETDITDDLACNDGISLEVVLTRRNAFGPLHQLPLLTNAYGPFSFITEGDEFSENYMLIPSGLLSEPHVIIRCEKDCK